MDFSAFSNWFNGLIDSLKALPQKIIDGLKSVLISLFVPDKDAYKEDLNALTNSINHTFNLFIDSEDWLVDAFKEEAIPDETGEYNLSGVGTLQLTFLDTTFLKRGIEYFRPIIRGFVVLLLIFFNYKQVLTFIGQDPSIAHNAEAKYNEWKGEKGDGS